MARRVRGEHRIAAGAHRNLLVWHGQLWAIDHGAALYFHFRDAWTDPERFAVQPYDASEHVLFGYAEATGHADAELASRVT